MHNFLHFKYDDQEESQIYPSLAKNRVNEVRDEKETRLLLAKITFVKNAIMITICFFNKLNDICITNYDIQILSK